MQIYFSSRFYLIRAVGGPFIANFGNFSAKLDTNKYWIQIHLDNNLLNNSWKLLKIIESLFENIFSGEKKNIPKIFKFLGQGVTYFLVHLILYRLNFYLEQKNIGKIMEISLYTKNTKKSMLGHFKYFLPILGHFKPFYCYPLICT